MADAGRPSVLPAVLLVDDDADLRALLSLALRRARFDTLEAGGGEEALALIASQPVDLVVCDFRMPGMTGLDLVRELRRQPETATMPFLLMTGSGDSDIVVSALAAGADDFLAKPVRLEELVARVQAHLRTQSAWTEVVEHELRSRADAVEALARLAVSTVPEEFAESVVAELGRRAAADFVGVTQILTTGRLQPLARWIRGRGVVRGGPALGGGRARELIAQAHAGPWSQRVNAASPSERRDAVASGEPGTDDLPPEVDIAAGAPIHAGQTLVGILTIAAPAGGGHGSLHALQARLLASVIDYATVLSAVAGQAISDRRAEATERTRLRSILAARAYRPVYQPIVRLDTRRPVGREALTRFDDGTRPDIRFGEATTVGLGPDFEVAAIGAAIEGARTLPATEWLTLNVSPDVVLHAGRRLRAALEPAGRPLVLELTEHTPVANYEAFRRAVRRLGDLEIAVDDAGAGYSSLRHILELGPAYAKLDMSLVRRIDGDPLRQGLVAGLGHFSATTGCRLIAEGVESEAEATTLAGLGVEFGQGYLFGRPAEYSNGSATAGNA